MWGEAWACWVGHSVRTTLRFMQQLAAHTVCWFTTCRAHMNFLMVGIPNCSASELVTACLTVDPLICRCQACVRPLCHAFAQVGGLPWHIAHGFYSVCTHCAWCVVFVGATHRPCFMHEIAKFTSSYVLVAGFNHSLVTGVKGSGQDCQYGVDSVQPASAWCWLLPQETRV